MRVGTWNVEYGVRGRNPDRRAILMAHDADVWVLTETNSALDLSSRLLPVSSEPRYLPDEGARWVTIWSRFPLLRCLAVPDPRRMVAAVLDTPAGPLAVAGVVLPWHSDVGDAPVDPPPRNWQEHRRVLRDEVPRLLRGLRIDAPDARRVVAGDFNTDLAAPHSYGLVSERRELARLLAEESLCCHIATVLYPPPSPPRTLIDHVCTTWGPAQAVETWTGEDGGRPAPQRPSGGRCHSPRLSRACARRLDRPGRERRTTGCPGGPRPDTDWTINPPPRPRGPPRGRRNLVIPMRRCRPPAVVLLLLAAGPARAADPPPLHQQLAKEPAPTWRRPPGSAATPAAGRCCSSSRSSPAPSATTATPARSSARTSRRPARRRPRSTSSSRCCCRRRSIKKGYETVVVTTTDGRTLTGPARRGDAPTRSRSSTRRRTASAITVAKADIEKRTAGTQVAHAGRAGQPALRPAAVPRPREVPHRDRRAAGRRARRSCARRMTAARHPGVREGHRPRRADPRRSTTRRFRRGEAIYARVCANCHGTKDQPGLAADLAAVRRRHASRTAATRTACTRR